MVVHGMEDGELAAGSNSSRSNNISWSSSLLYCHEDPLLVSSTPGGGGAPEEKDDAAADHERRQQQQLHDDEEKKLVIDELEQHIARQGCYAPSSTAGGGYIMQLLQVDADACGVAAARSRGVHYILYAFGRLGLATSTAFNAVNYLDRFLSINCHLRWDEAWMAELVSLACLSVACKLDEVNIPSLHHLQMEEVMTHSFRASTIRDMELTLLKALQWRLACVTPYSFLHLLLPLVVVTNEEEEAAAAACQCLLLRSLAEPSLLLRFEPSVIAASALRCCVPAAFAASANHVISRLLVTNTTRPPSDHCFFSTAARDAAADECFKMMRALFLSTTVNDDSRSAAAVSHRRRRRLSFNSMADQPSASSTQHVDDDHDS